MDVVAFTQNLSTGITKMKMASELNMPVELTSEENKAVIAAIRAFRDSPPGSIRAGRRGRSAIDGRFT